MANEQLSEKLYTALEADYVEIIDNSWMHAGHVAMANVNTAEGTHLKIIVVAKRFENVSLLERHRQVHQILKSDFEGPLHALELKPLSPSEWKNQSV